ncbi:phage tail protein [Salmonella enterica]|nr:phage tail protein [Salmonella enterica]OIN15026.1 phage tail protein [Salmonella enterica subsp. enterica serovar Sarajane]ECI9840196.1 phage tail protein [Salmonella enterica]EDA0234956.1 phage tail protein [Salmonella enterica]EFR3657677.1 phage tail protein [Salmonella enterica]
MKTFHWKVSPGMEVESEPGVVVVRFGDGHEQRRAGGLNNDLRKYNITLSVARRDAPRVDNFLSEHGGVRAFLWTPPYHWRQIRVVCRKWSVRVGATRAELTATFEQVVN